MYYPLSQIKTNLYTNGGEFCTQQNNPASVYVGYYWKTSKEEYFTGKTPQDLPTQPLFLIKNVDLQVVEPLPVLETNVITSVDIQPELSSYVKLKNINISKVISMPYYSPTIPTSQDYQIGEFRRYFCKKTNEISYLEINKDIYDKLVGENPTILYQLYQPFNIPWQLTGDKTQVYKTNKNIVELTMKQQKLPQFNKYLKEDYIKYYK